MRISAIIVNYNSGALLKECVGSLKMHLRGKDEIIVVDNKSEDGSLSTVERIPHIKIVRVNDNIGYGGGCNRGYWQSSGDLLLYLNPDVRMISPAGIVLNNFRRERNCAVVAPGLVEEGVLCNSIKPLPTVLMDAFGEMGIHFIRKSRSKGVGHAFNGFSTGAVLFVRRTAYERAGGFDEGFFLYYEETDLFKRLKDLGYIFRYEPGCVFEHASGGSSGTLHWKRTAIRYNSKYRYFAKHTSKYELAAHRALTILALLLKFAAGCIRPGGREKLNAYLYALELYMGRPTAWR